MEKQTDTPDLEPDPEGIAIQAHAYELRDRARQRHIEKLEERLREQLTLNAKLAESDVEKAQAELEVARLEAELEGLTAEQLDPRRMSQRRARLRARVRMRREDRENGVELSPREAALGPLALPSVPTLRFIGEVVEAE